MWAPSVFLSRLLPLVIEQLGNFSSAIYLAEGYAGNRRDVLQHKVGVRDCFGCAIGSTYFSGPLLWRT
jgi:hypothetical protein